MPHSGERWRSRKYHNIFEVMLIQVTNRPIHQEWVLYQQVFDNIPCGGLALDTMRTFTEFYERVLF